MPVPKKTDSISRKHWKKTRNKKLQRKKKPGVRINRNCILCIYGAPPTINAKIRCIHKKPDVVFNHEKKYWMCHSFEMDRRLS